MLLHKSCLSVKCLAAFGDGWWEIRAIWKPSVLPSPPSPPTKVLSGSWSWEFIQHASFYPIRREPKISQLKFTSRSWWSYWLSVDINYTGTTTDRAAFSLCCLVFVIAAGFLSVIFLKVRFSPPSRVSDMKLVRTNLDISLCSCIIQFPDSIRKVDKEKIYH